MVTAAQRVLIKAPVWTIHDTQPMVLLPGSVIDIPASVTISPSTHQVLGTTTPASGEAPGTLAPHGGSTSVRNIRTQA